MSRSFEMRKAVSWILVVSILSLSGEMFGAGRKGAELYIKKKDGHFERGELIAVRQSSLLLLDRYSGADVAVDIDDIRSIRIERKSLAREGAYIGLFIGAGSGAVIGAREAEKDKNENFLSAWFSEFQFAAYGLLLGLAGLIIGGILGQVVSADSTIQVEGKPDLEIKKILEKLRKKARIKNAQ
jgi:hypothetical protein